MSALDPARLLAIWESGSRRHPIDRALLLFALAAPDRNPDDLADASIGERNVAIMDLREECFGSLLNAWVDCPACGERMEFELHPSMLPARPESTMDEVAVGELRFALPTSRHLAAVIHHDDPDTAAVALLRQCVIGEDDTTLSPTHLSALMDEASAAIDAADPWADISLNLSCPNCQQLVSACFDIATILWDELETHARQLLDHVHILASAYGWTEPEILALSDSRRLAYLDRVHA